jgi:hypothetical protein
VLRKFQATDGSGSVYVNPDDVSMLAYDEFAEGVRITLKSGREVVVDGVLEEVAILLGHQ